MTIVSKKLKNANLILDDSRRKQEELTDWKGHKGDLTHTNKTGKDFS